MPGSSSRTGLHILVEQAIEGPRAIRRERFVLAKDAIQRVALTTSLERLSWLDIWALPVSVHPLEPVVIQPWNV